MRLYYAYTEDHTFPIVHNIIQFADKIPLKIVPQIERKLGLDNPSKCNKCLINQYQSDIINSVNDILYQMWGQ